jgi:hypothetical protein
MTKLTETQTLILSAGAQRHENIALPLPKGLAGAAAKMAVTKMNEPLWRETGDGHGTTLVVTEAGLLAIGIEPMVKTVVAIRRHVAETPAPMEATAAQPKQRAGTKQAMLIEMLRRPEGGTMEEIMAATGWLAHTARGAMSGALGKKLGLVVTSEKDALRGRVYKLRAT